MAKNTETRSGSGYQDIVGKTENEPSAHVENQTIDRIIYEARWLN
jgi:hypothetical protein